MPATTFTAVLPDGRTATRTSASKTYTHAVAVFEDGGYYDPATGLSCAPSSKSKYGPFPAGPQWRIENWCGRPDLAEKAAAVARNPRYGQPRLFEHVRIVDVAT